MKIGERYLYDYPGCQIIAEVIRLSPYRNISNGKVVGFGFLDEMQKKYWKFGMPITVIMQNKTWKFLKGQEKPE